MSTIFPSKNAWITPRTNEARLTDQNCRIMLPQKIEKLDKVVLNLPNVKVRFEGAGPLPPVLLSQVFLDEKHTKSLVELDITSYVVEKAKYDTLGRSNANLGISSGLQYLENTWYYEHNGNEIILPNGIMKGNLPVPQNSPVTDYVITSAIYNVVYNDGKKDGKLYVYYGSNNPDNRTLTIDDNFYVFIENGVNIMDIPFRIYYTPLGESVKLNVPKTNPQAEQFVIPYSQQQPIVDNQTHGREMQSVANRAGCETKEVVRTFPGIEHYRSPHDHWFYREKDKDGKPTGNVWRLTSATLSVVGYNRERNTHVYRSHEVWSKNWSYRNPNVPINREFRSWNIPADIVQRNLLWQDYCLITKKSVTLPDSALFSDWAKKQLLNALANYNGTDLAKNEMSVLWFYTKNGGGRTGVALSCSAFGFGDSLVFTGKTKDNLSAGVQRVASDENDDNYQFCKDVYYCNEDGTLDNMCIQLAGDMQSDDDTVAARV